MQDQGFVIGDYDWLKTQGGPPAGNRRYAILRVGKIKTKGHLGAALAHNFRERHTSNADADRLHDNTVLKGADGAQGVIAAWDARAPEKIRKNAVHALEYFVGASPEKMAAMTRDQQDAYFRKALDWFKGRHGAENVLSAVIHRDETTPHMQMLVIPLDARGKLNARELVGGKATLSKMQTDFARDVGQDFGLERGKERSQATHQTIKEYYARANATPETYFQLPERHKGNLLGVGRESDEDWRQRASEAARDAVARTKAQYEERLHQIERGAAQLLSGIRAQEKALRREFGKTTPEERQMATLHMNGLLITAGTRELSHMEGIELTEAAETSFGPEGMKKLLTGDVSQCPGETNLDRIRAGLDILRSYEVRGMDLSVPLQRMKQDIDRDAEERRLEQERARSEPQTSFIAKSHDRERDDDWDL
ncbi:MobV family relaxase [Falsirhodobacter xinxiangensis]|uniref:MobV family relaxase n=1 Tax=Falsirhodobacter xinxiangensis TaxID=2530049 RepID=UPI0010AB0E85|nr:MobV family relaxase [Rhodobacter xinxiangensis]